MLLSTRWVMTPTVLLTQSDLLCPAGHFDRAVRRSLRAYSSNVKVCWMRWPQGFSSYPLNQIKIADNDCGLHTLQLLALALSVGADWIVGGLSWTTVGNETHSAPVSFAWGVLWPKICLDSLNTEYCNGQQWCPLATWSEESETVILESYLGAVTFCLLTVVDCLWLSCSKDVS